MIKRMVVVVVFWACSLCAQSERPRVVVFNVPLQLHEMNENISRVNVKCSCFKNGQDIVAQGELFVDIPRSGNLVQTVTITATELEGRNILEATSYGCGMILFDREGTILYPTDDPNAPVDRKAKPGTTFQNQVTGTLVW